MAAPKLKITSTDDAANENIKALLFGFAGSGKTYSAASLPGKTLIISCEGGLLGLRGKNIPVFDLAIDDEGKPIADYALRIRRLGEVFTYLNTTKEYDNVFLDSMTEIAEMLVVIVQKEFPDRKDSFPMWAEYGKRMRAIVKNFRDLKGYNVFMTCLAETDTDENKRRFLACDMPGKIGKQLPQFFDEVLYVYRNAEGEHRYFTKRTDTNISKDRSGKLDDDMPADLGLVMLKIFDKDKKEKTK